MKAYLIDFEDSFTLNIYCELKELGLSVEVVPFKKALDFLSSLVNTRHKLALILGPGPGHPDEYREFVAVLKNLLQRENTFLMGVCLGHQIIGRAMGMEVERSNRPCHGEVERVSLSKVQKGILGLKEPILVQRYNSLALPWDANQKTAQARSLDISAAHNEIYVMSRPGLLTYQFHPESVGTSFRSRFFRPLQAFLL